MGDGRCPECCEPYRAGISCTIDHGALRFGDEPDLGPAELLEDPGTNLDDLTCRSCGVYWGGQHHALCTVATCRRCEGQTLGHTWRECLRNRRRARRP